MSMTSGRIQADVPFIRDRFTWQAYLLLASFTYLQAILGPLMPFLRDEFNLSYTVGGLHLSAFALGMVIAGVGGAVLVQALGREVVLRGGAVGMAAAACLLAFGSHVLATLGASLVMGLAGALMLVTVQSTLADRHGRWRALAFTEANIAGGLSAGLAPLLLGVFQRVGIGWRSAVYSAVMGLAVLLIVRARTRVLHADPPRQARAAARERLPLAFWVSWTIILLGVAIEFCLIGWGADFLHTAAGLEKSTASSVMAAFFVAIVLGRLAGGRLTRVMEASSLLVVAVGIIMCGFPIFWLAPSPLIKVVGLFVTGLGAGNVFPLTLAIALSVAPDTDAASARVTMGAGLAILIAPLTLGWIADAIGMANAYGATLVLIAAALAMVLVARWLARRAHSANKSVRAA